ncbi:MAG: hypothetical protein LBO09_03935 [Candidatus Peribacteria bacterium]|jgi:hypothetical protein|nr:hypothetical protein [Candidatus Peribacteria bacterium]
MQPTLQQTFPEIYKKLFSENEVVLSGHFGFNWFPSGIGHTTNFISIKQKIKSKCYVGIRKVSQIGISFDEILMFDGTTFSPYPPEHIDLYYHEALAYLAETFDLEKLGYGFRISVISESARGEGVGFTGTLCSLLSF